MTPEQKALQFFQRSLRTLPERIRKRQEQGHLTSVQELELEYLPFAISALQYVCDLQDYEASQQSHS